MTMFFPNLDLSKISANNQTLSNMPLSEAVHYKNLLLLVAVGYPKQLPAILQQEGLSLQIEEGARVQ